MFVYSCTFVSDKCNLLILYSSNQAEKVVYILVSEQFIMFSKIYVFLTVEITVFSTTRNMTWSLCLPSKYLKLLLLYK